MVEDPKASGDRSEVELPRPPVRGHHPVAVDRERPVVAASPRGGPFPAALALADVAPEAVRERGGFTGQVAGDGAVATVTPPRTVTVGRAGERDATPNANLRV